MLQGVENKHRFRDFYISQPFELLPNLLAVKKQLGELKHLISQGNEGDGPHGEDEDKLSKN